MEQKKHVSKAAHDEEFWNVIKSSHEKYMDWVVVSIFYSAMHFIDAFFGKKGRHLKSHDMADKEIAQDKELTSIYHDYRALKDYRWKASYWSTIFKPEEIDKDIVPHFDNIKSSIMVLLSKK